MSFCTKCGAVLNEEALYCSKCGSPVPKPVGLPGSPTAFVLDKEANKKEKKKYNKKLWWIFLTILTIFCLIMNVPYIPVITCIIALILAKNESRKIKVLNYVSLFVGVVFAVFETVMLIQSCIVNK